MGKTILVLKASGGTEKFDRNKIKKTCVYAGAPEDLAEKVTKEVTKHVYDGISTKEILKLTVKLLEKELPHVAAKYDLKGAIMRLGPEGYPFERFFAEVLKEYGYSARGHQYVQGLCVKHEIDIVAAKPQKEYPELGQPPLKYYMIENKFHNSPGIYTGLKESLYTFARFLDLEDGYKKGLCQKFDQAWLVCNTKFSADAIQYAICKNLKLTGWRYPLGASLETMIEEKDLYPITVVKGLDKDSQKKMFDAGLLLCKDLLKYDIDKLRERTRISSRVLTNLINTAKEVMIKKEF